MPGGRPRKVQPRWPLVSKRPYGMGSISRNQTTGVLRARLPVRIDPKRSSREFGPDDLAGASAWLDAEIARATSGQAHTAATTVGEWSGFWLETFVEPFRSPNTLHLYRYALRYLEPEYPTRLDALKTTALQVIVKTLVSRVGPANIENIIGVWRRCLQAAVEDNLIAKNPARKLIVPDAPRSTSVRALPVEAITTLRDGIVGQRFEVAYALVLGCALRIGEVLGLHWSDVDLEGHRAWIQHQYSNGHWISLPKGKNPHWVTLPDFAIAALIRHRDRQPAGATLVMESPYRGKLSRKHKQPTPWSRNAVSTDFSKLLTELGLEHVTPHAGRHGLASYWLDNGVPPTVIAEKLGHADPGITLRVYSHASKDGHARADELVNELLGSPRTEATG